MVDEHLRGRRNHSSVLWQMLVFELWQRNFMEARVWGADSTDRVLAGHVGGETPPGQPTRTPALRS
jgi:hypothetical protein